MRKVVFFNGKFYSGGLNGVHRVADRLIREVDALAAERPEVRDQLDLQLLIPEKRSWTPALKVIQLRPQPRGHTQQWEQFLAPRVAKAGLLVNLCNLAPIAHRRKLTLIHDAQFFLFRGSYPLHFQVGYRLLTPWMARTSVETLTVSEFSREMLSIFGVSRHERTSVMYPGVDHLLDVPADPDIVGRLGVTPGRYVVIFGTTAPYKNIKVVLQAFADPALSDLDLVVMGATAEQLAAAGLTAPPRCRFVPKLDDGCLKALYESALCVAYPSRTEGFGLPPLEAMTCGAPAVVAPAGAIPEVCGDAVLYAGVSDPAAWVRGVRALADDEPLRQSKSSLGRGRASAFTWRRSGEQLLDTILRRAG